MFCKVLLLLSTSTVSGLTFKKTATGYTMTETRGYAHGASFDVPPVEDPWLFSEDLVAKPDQLIKRHGKDWSLSQQAEIQHGNENLHGETLVAKYIWENKASGFCYETPLDNRPELATCIIQSPFQRDWSEIDYDKGEIGSRPHPVADLQGEQTCIGKGYTIRLKPVEAFYKSTTIFVTEKGKEILYNPQWLKKTLEQYPAYSKQYPQCAVAPEAVLNHLAEYAGFKKYPLDETLVAKKGKYIYENKVSGFCYETPLANLPEITTCVIQSPIQRDMGDIDYDKGEIASRGPPVADLEGVQTCVGKGYTHRLDSCEVFYETTHIYISEKGKGIVFNPEWLAKTLFQYPAYSLLHPECANAPEPYLNHLAADVALLKEGTYPPEGGWYGETLVAKKKEKKYIWENRVSRFCYETSLANRPEIETCVIQSPFQRDLGEISHDKGEIASRGHPVLDEAQTCIERGFTIRLTPIEAFYKSTAIFVTEKGNEIVYNPEWLKETLGQYPAYTKQYPQCAVAPEAVLNHLAKYAGFKKYPPEGVNRPPVKPPSDVGH